MYRKLLYAFLLTSLCLFPSESKAEAIFWNQLTLFLDTITFTTSGDLEVNFTHGAPHGNFVSRDEVWYEDIYENHVTLGDGVNVTNCNYTAGYPDSFTTVSKTWDLTSTGSGYLDFNIDFFWDYNALPGYMPDSSWAGPDDFEIFVIINNLYGVGHAQLDVLPPQAIWGHTYGPTFYFGEGEIQNLTLIAQTCANGGWINMPAPQPVPEPTTILLFGLGTIGFWAKRKFSKSKIA